MKRFFQKLFGSKNNGSTLNKSNKYRPMVDALEERRLLNNDFTSPAVDANDDLFCISDDVLYIRGTDLDNGITIEINPEETDEVQVTVYEIEGWNIIELDSEDYEIDDFDYIVVRGFGGNDVILNMTDLDTSMFGGEGNDDFYGGGGDDTMVGGVGNDEYHFEHEFQSVKFPGEEYTFANLGSDTVIENVGEGTDRLRFSDLDGAVDLDMADVNTQTVSAGRLNLTLRDDAFQTAEIENVYGTNFSDTIYGNDFANYLSGRSGDDELVGRGGNDTLSGSYGDDTLVGEAGNDSLLGSYGDDTLEGGAGNDTLKGGMDDDTYVFDNAQSSSLGTDTVTEYNGQGRDTMDFSALDYGIRIDLSNASNQTIHNGWSWYSTFTLTLNVGTSEIEDVKGTDHGDKVTGNHLDNRIWTYGGGDQLQGLGGDDTLEGGSGSDQYLFDNRSVTNLGHDQVIEASNVDNYDRLNFYSLDRGIQLDLDSTQTQTVASGAVVLTLSSTTGIEYVNGSQHSDLVEGNSRNNWISSYDGNDTLRGHGGQDSLYGGNGGDWLYGGDQDDYISGGNDSDWIYGGNHDDRINGDNGNDYLFGEGGTDTITGGDGADALHGGYGGYYGVYTQDYGNDQLYGYTLYSNSDGDRDIFKFHRRYVYQNGMYTSVDAGWETLAGYNSSEDLVHNYYSWSW